MDLSRNHRDLPPVRDSDTAFYDSDFDFSKDGGRNKKYSES